VGIVHEDDPCQRGVRILTRIWWVLSTRMIQENMDRNPVGNGAEPAPGDDDRDGEGLGSLRHHGAGD
jgi:hypothetical protein